MGWISRTGRALAGGVLLLMAAAPGLAAPQSPTPKAAAPAVPYTQETAPRISPEEARQALAKGEAVLVDVRSKEAYEASHAKGALSIPSFALDSRLGELPKNKLIITYCTWPAEHTSAGAVLTLLAKGFTKVACLRGGLDAWSKAGGEVVKTQMTPVK